jgi:superfamily I DNA/RNA helicase
LLAALLSQVHETARTIIPSEEELSSVMDHIALLAQRWEATTVDDLVNAVTSPDDTLDQELDPGKVNILSMHRAKGLSSPAVIVVGAEQELVPGNAADEAFHDERRLLYVSLTRARHFLVATYCNRRTGWQMHSGSNPGNPARHLTPFLRGALPVESGEAFVIALPPQDAE